MAEPASRREAMEQPGIGSKVMTTKPVTYIAGRSEATPASDFSSIVVVAATALLFAVAFVAAVVHPARATQGDGALEVSSP